MSFEVTVERAGLGYELVCRGRRRVLGALPEVGARYDAACDTEVAETRDGLLVAIGRELFAWLDGAEGWLRGWVAEDDPAPVLRLDLHAAEPAFGKAPWELLHDGVSFLALRGMVVTRVVSLLRSAGVRANRYLEILFVAMAPEEPWPSLIPVLGNLGVVAETGVAYLAPAVWLAGRVQALTGSVIRVLASLVGAWGSGNSLVRPLALQAAGHLPDGHPELQELRSIGFGPLAAIAEAEGVPPEEFPEWALQELAASFDKPALEAGLERLIGDTWLFDRTKVGATKGQGA